MGVAGAVLGRRPRVLGAARRGAGRRGRPPRHAGRAAAHELVTRPWPAPPRCCAATTRHARRAARGRPRPAARPRAGSRRSSAAACAPRWHERDGRRGGRLMDVAPARSPTSSRALIFVYTIIIFAWIVVSLVFSLGVRVPYNALAQRGPGLPARRHRARTCGSSAGSALQFGPIDLSPIVAIIVLQIVRRHHRRPDRARDRRAGGRLRAALVAVGGRRRRPGDEGARARRRSAAASGSSVLPGHRPRPRAQHRRRVRHVLAAAGALVVLVAVVALGALLVVLRHAPATGRWCGCRPACCSAARPGNLIDRVRDGAVTDFIKLPHWPAFNVADIGDHGRRARAALRARGPPRRCRGAERRRLRRAGERLDVFLAGARRLARRGAAADRRRRSCASTARRGPSATRWRGGERDRRSTSRRGRAERRRRRRRAFAIAYEDEHLLVVDKPAGVVVHPARGHRDGHARRRRSPAASPAATDPERAGHRAPARPRHVRPARVARSSDVHARAAGARCARATITREYLALVEGRPPARARHDRRAARPRPPRAHADVDRHRRRRATRSRTSRSSATLPDDDAAARARWRPAARTRSARTCWRSAIRSRGDPEYGTRGRARPRSASSCTPRGWRSRTRSPGAPIDARLAAAGGPRAQGRSGRRSGGTNRPTGGRGREGRPVAGSNAGVRKNLS